MARGHIQQRQNGTFRVLVYAGKDPLTGKERRLTGTAPTRKEAEQLRTRLLSKVDQGRMSGSKATLGEVLERWLDTAELEMTTRHCYQDYITSKILPALGDVQARKITVETLDRFYAELRKRGGAKGQPLAPMTVRQIHFIIRAALNLAVKWEWITDNPAERATVPRYVRQDVPPPTPDEVAAFMEAAWQRDPDLGTLLWLAMVTGARRGELCGLRWSYVRPAEGFLLISRSYVQKGANHQEKDTKTHQARRVALDEVTVEILTEHRARCDERAAVCSVTVKPDGYLFSLMPDASAPLLPETLSGRMMRLTKTTGIHITLRSLRHYAATQMLTSGIDLRTTAGRLGHGDGGTTLKVYTHFLPAPDLRAAQVLANSVPRPGQSKA